MYYYQQYKANLRAYLAGKITAVASANITTEAPLQPVTFPCITLAYTGGKMNRRKGEFIVEVTIDIYVKDAATDRAWYKAYGIADKLVRCLDNEWTPASTYKIYRLEMLEGAIDIPPVDINEPVGVRFVYSLLVS